MGGSVPESELSCQELIEIVTEYLAGTLPNPARRRFDEHLAGCPGCYAYLDQMRRTIVAVGRLREDDLPPRARDDLLHLFRARKQS